MYKNNQLTYVINYEKYLNKIEFIYEIESFKQHIFASGGYKLVITDKWKLF